MNYKGALEAILFAFGDEGIPIEQIKQVFNMNEASFIDFLETFMEDLKNDSRGLECVNYGGYLKLVTKKGYHDLISELLEFRKSKQLSQAALETLAIIAYKQPITRLEIEEIRGVNSDMMCRRLEAMDLIKEVGRQESVGRPILYEVTPSFMDVFKLTSLKELPEIKLESLEDVNGLFK